MGRSSGLIYSQESSSPQKFFNMLQGNLKTFVFNDDLYFLCFSQIFLSRWRISKYALHQDPQPKDALKFRTSFELNL